MKNTFIALIVIVFLFLIVGGYFFWKLNPQTVNTPSSNNTTTSSGNTNVSSGNTTVTSVTNTTGTANTTVIKTTDTRGANLTFSTREGEVVVSNFYKNPQTQILDEQNDAVIKEDPNFSIGFFARDNSFSITLLGPNLAQDRAAAEQEFLNRLGITKEQACKLTVTVMAPASVSRNASGIDFGLSFCPNGKIVPTNAGPTESSNWP